MADNRKIILGGGLEADISTMSLVGDRAVNEDAVGCAQRQGITVLAVADGCGGHESGEVAAAAAVKAALAVHSNNIERAIEKAFERAQINVLAEQQRLSRDTLATLSVVMTDGKRLLVGHAGDTRVYIFKRKRIDYITRDHSVAAQLAASGLLKEKYIRTSPDRNRLLRVVGIEGEPPFTGIDLKTDILPGDCILICTDGFWEYMSERRMLAALRRAKSASDWLAAMEKRIEKKAVSGAADNRSAIAAIISRTEGEPVAEPKK